MKVGALGDAVMDLLLFIEGLGSGLKMEYCRPLTSYHFSPGGSSANYAVALGKLSIPVFFIGKIGKDDLGECLLKEFKENNVDTRYTVIAEDLKTSLATIVIEKNSSKRISLSYWKTYTSLRLEELNQSFLDEIGFLAVSGYALIQNPLRTTVLKLLMKAKKIGISTLLDPCPYFSEIGLPSLSKILRYVDILTPNHRELTTLTKTRSIERGLRKLGGYGPKILVAKLGEKGCAVLNGGEVTFIRGFKVKIAETGGAGDAFCAGLTYGLIKGLSPLQAGVIGNALGALAVTGIGSRARLPNVNDLKVFLRKHEKNSTLIRSVLKELGW